MAHFAYINEDNIVTQIIVAEQSYINILVNKERWIQTSYNTREGIHLLGGEPLRYNYAGLGFTYDSVRDAFIPPKPYSDWILNETTCTWKAPIDRPDDENSYTWIENVGWQLVNND